MKNIITTLCLFFCFVIAGNSQFHFGAGAQFIFDGSVLGIQGKALYEINDEWRAAGGFTYHLEDFINYSIDLDAQYKAVEISDNFNFAPLAGISITSYDFGGFIGSATETGLNLGAFLDFGGDEGLHFYLEPKINIGGYESLSVAGGILF